MKIFILAGGFGTRLQSVVSDVPKPMAPILDKPFLDYQLSEIRKYFPKNKIYLLTFYKSEIIENYYKNDKLISIIKETEPLGTGGSIKNAISYLQLEINSKILVFNGDTYIKPNLNKMLSSSENTISILGSFQEDCQRYGTLKLDKDDIVEFNEKVPNCKDSYINAGCYLFNDLSLFKKIDKKLFSIEDEFKNYLNNYGKINIYRYENIFIDIGIAQDYKKMIKYMSKSE